MHWNVIAPFIESDRVGWIPGFVPPDRHSFTFIPADYTNDRSRKNASAKEWLGYFRHALKAWRRTRRDQGLITSFPQLPTCLGLLKRLTCSRVPIVAWCFNMGSTYGGLKGHLARFALKSVDLFVVHSTAEIDTYSQWLGIPPERFVFVPLSIEIKSPPSESWEEEPFVLAMGTANRDYRTLIEALKPLGYRTLIVAGEHALTNVDLPPFVEHRSGLSLQTCHDLARRARVNVVPVADAKAASGQVTLLETMMFGKAIIATSCAGTVDYITHGADGMLVAVGDVTALTGAIQSMWSNEDQRRYWGAAARQIVLSRHTFAAVAPQMSSLLDRAARNSIRDSFVVAHSSTTETPANDRT